MQLAQAQDARYFEGKTIRVSVGLAAGGTSDTFIRTFTEYWQKYIPGDPTVLVENMPGSGNLLATNYVHESAEPDGLIFVYLPWDPIAQPIALTVYSAFFVWLWGRTGPLPALLYWGGRLGGALRLPRASAVHILATAGLRHLRVT